MEMYREKAEESSDEEQEQAGEPKGEGLALTASSGSELSLEKKIGPICFKLHRAGFRDRAGPLDCRHHCHRRGRIVFGCRGSREDGRCILPRPRGGQCSRSCRLVCPRPPGPSPPRLLLEGDVTATRSSFIFSAASFFPSPPSPSPSRAWLSWRLFQSSFLPRCLLQEPSVHSQPAHHGTSGGIRLGAACCCGGGRRGRWCAVFAFEAACPSTRCHQSLAALARPFSLSPSPFPVLNKPGRVPASGCIGWHSEREKKPQEPTSDICCCLPTDIVVSPSLGPMHPAAQVWPEKGKGGGWKGGKASCSGTPIRSVQDRGKGEVEISESNVTSRCKSCSGQSRRRQGGSRSS